MGVKIKELPINERPREKAIRYGVENLSNIELLTIIIGSGTKGYSAMDISYELFNQYKGMKNLVSSSSSELEKIKGISKATSLKLTAVFELFKRIEGDNFGDEYEIISPEHIYKKYARIMNDTKQENVGVIILNKNKKILREKILYKGTQSEVSISYFEVIKEALLVNGKHLYVFHNHPSGDSTPSTRDVFFTRGLMQELDRIGIKLIDHVVLGDENFYSFKQATMFELEK